MHLNPTPSNFPPVVTNSHSRSGGSEHVLDLPMASCQGKPGGVAFHRPRVTWGMSGEGSSAPVMPTQAEPNWSAWSREAVRLMQERNRAWMEDYGLQGCQYVWTFDDAQLVFRPGSDEVVADICVLGSVSEAEGTFLWAWANET